MLSLAALPVHHVFSFLDLKDLARCRRVSVLFKYRVEEEFLPTVTQIIRGDDPSCTDTFFRYTKPMKQRLTADFSGAFRGAFWRASNERRHPYGYYIRIYKARMLAVSSLMRFIAKYCSNVISIYAPDVTVHLLDLSPLAPQLVYFCFQGISYAGDVTRNASSFIAFFPKLHSFNLQGVVLLCRSELTQAYHSQSLKQFTQYCNLCTGVSHSCLAEGLLLPSLTNIEMVPILSIDKLHPSSLHSLRYVKLREIDGANIGSKMSSITLPNLLSFHLSQFLEDLVPIMKSLSRSTRLEALTLWGFIGYEAVLALQDILQKCPILQMVEIHSQAVLETIEDNPDEHCIDTRICKNLKFFLLGTTNFTLTIKIPWACFNRILFDNVDGKYGIVLEDSNTMRPPLQYRFVYPHAVYLEKQPQFTGKLEISIFCTTRRFHGSGGVLERLFSSFPNTTCLLLTSMVPRLLQPLLIEIALRTTAIRMIELQNPRWGVVRSDIPYLKEIFSLIANHPNRSLCVTYDLLTRSLWRSISDSRRLIDYLARERLKTNFKLCSFNRKGFKLLTGSFALSRRS